MKIAILVGLSAILPYGSPAFAGAWGAGSSQNDDALEWLAEPR